jgi:hypothetical protein
MSEYTRQANEFCKRNGATMKIMYSHFGQHFDNDTTGRDIYKIRIDRAGRSMTFSFGNSVHNTERNIRPTKYDVLVCLTKYEPSVDVWDFAAEYGYEIHDRATYKAVERIYKAVRREYAAVCRVFGDVIGELAEIQ